MQRIRERLAASVAVVALGAGMALGGCAETSMSGDKMGDKMMEKKDAGMMDKKEGTMMEKK